MKREDLLKLASEIFDYEFRENTPQFARIERFARRIAEHEREECAKVCEAVANKFFIDSEQFDSQEDSDFNSRMWGAEECTDAIRARSE